MTNKTLFIAVCVVVIMGAGLGGYYYWQNTRPLVVSPDQIGNQNNSNQPNNPQMSFTPPPSGPTSTPAMASSTPDSACRRDFSETKLGANASLSINNRTVQIDVKNFGQIRLGFYEKDAPKTVENFLRLTDAGFFDCLTFHRVAKGFVIQGGDPKGDGTGGLSAYGAPFADELNPNTPSYKTGYVKGVLAMANSGPNTNSSQFFIMLGDNSLPHNYTIFGHVTIGQDVVDKIGQVDITPVMGPTDGSPKVPVVMESVKIIK
jgi:cyclophilin family peptidyl-prolyl cis-trans isomerase